MSVESFEPLEAELRALSARLVYPPTPDLASAVGDSLRARPTVRMRARRWWNSPAVAAVAAAVAAVLAVVLLVSPAAREAVASVFRGVRGIRIVVGSPPTERPSSSAPSTKSAAAGTPSISSSPAAPSSTSATSPPVSSSYAAPSVGPAPTLVGTPTTLATARRTLIFDPLLPSVLGPPDRVLLERDAARGTLTMVWQATPALPRAAGDVGAVLTEFKPDFADNFPYWTKTVASEGQLRSVDVNGFDGTWVEGRHRLDFRIPAPTGWDEISTSRIAANTLLWIQNGITVRLETALPLEDALRIAQSMR